MQRSGRERRGRGHSAGWHRVPPWRDFNHMHPDILRRVFMMAALLMLPATLIPSVWAQHDDPMAATRRDAELPRTGALRVRDPEGGGSVLLPLQHTTVRAQVSGPVAQVSVEQRFHNPYSIPIEAIYAFPLPDAAAVNDFELRIGMRIVRGEIHSRREAQQIYAQARQQGRVAALLDQERPNIFTQSIANIMPGHEIVVRLRYVEALDADDRGYALVFPTVVGPRYIPGTPRRPATVPAGWDAGGGAAVPPGHGWSPDTDRVPDASRITPPVLPPSVRSGHDLELSVDIESGIPVGNVRCESHAVDVERGSRTAVRVQLRPNDTIPNKDFVLRWDVAGRTPEFGWLCSRDPDNDPSGTFAFLLQPNVPLSPVEAPPKEMLFLLDTSGSMSGEPLAKVKAAVRWALQHLNPADTFQIIRFSDRASALAAEPLGNTPGSIAQALRFLDRMDAGGGTEMLAGIEAALCQPADPRRLRLVFFMTDGYIGNEVEILATVRRLRGPARLFAFGVGNSVNRYLLDRVAEEGRGTVDYVLLHEDTRAVVERFYRRVAQPCLTNLEIEWRGLEVTDLQPERLPDLFAGAPLTLCGRYAAPGRGTVVVRGSWGGKSFVREIPVVLPARAVTHAVLPVLWARRRLEHLSGQQDYAHSSALEEEITALALRYRLVSAYTSFVAVDNQVVNPQGKLVLVAQPVPMPEGVSYEGVFGRDAAMYACSPVQPSMPAPSQGGSLRSMMSVERAQDAEKTRDVVMSIEPVQRRYQPGAVIEVRITLHNRGRTAVELPQQLAFTDGTLILHIDGHLVTTATSARPQPGATQRLAPGATRSWTVRLPGDCLVAAGRHAVEIGIASRECGGLTVPAATCNIEML